MRLARFAGLMGLAGILLLAVSCSKDSNPVANPEFGEISGKVTFVGTWPQAGDVQVSIWASWPPAGPPAAATDPIQRGVSSVDYKIDGLSKGAYPVITVGWRDPSNPQGAKVIGIYWERADSLGVDALGNPTVAPKAIEIKDGQMIQKNLNIKANLDVVK